MNDPIRRATLVLFLIAGCAAAAIVRAQFGVESDLAEITLSGRTAESIILSWPTYSYRLARLMIDKYGQPSEATDQRVIWHDNGPWKRTVVHRDAPGRTYNRSRGRLEQSVAYNVPAQKLDALARFDKSIEAAVNEGLLTASSDDESANILALNLADEVLRGRRTAREATDFRQNVSRLRDSGRSSPYFERLMFVRRVRVPKPASPD
jgi:hypothetical protein